MRLLIAIILLTGSQNLIAQSIVIEDKFLVIEEPLTAEGKTFAIPFKVKGTTIRGNLKVSVKVNSGSTAIPKVEFELRNEKLEQEDQLVIKPLKYLAKFHIFVQGELELIAQKEIKLDFDIDDNGTVTIQTITFKLDPRKKAPEEEEQETASIVLYNDLGIFVINGSTGEKGKDEKKIEGSTVKGRSVNIQEVGVVERKDGKLDITLTTSYGEVFSNPTGISLGDAFDASFLLYLDGDTNGPSVRVMDFLKVDGKEEKKTKGPVKILTPQNPKIEIQIKKKKDKNISTNPILEAKPTNQ